MSKKSELEDALKEAMRAKDAARRNTLRLVLSAIKEAEVSSQAELDDGAITSIVRKAVKMRQEAEEEAKRAQRDDLIDEAKQEISILEEYLPVAMSDDDLTAIIDAAIVKSGASSQKEMGDVMKLVLPEVQGKADGGKVSQIVRQKLQGE
jgi:uncharacterized protein YqeY